MTSHPAARAGGAASVDLLAPRFLADPTRRSARLLRAGAFAGAGTLLAIAAHRIGGGGTPTGRAQFLAFGALFLLGLPISRRQRGGRCLVALVVVTQLLLHVGFALCGMRGGGSGRGSMWDMVLLCHPIGHAPSAAQLAAARAAVSGLQLPHTAAPASMNQLGAMALLMLGAHLLAAAALAWWLRRGERAAWAVAARIVATIRRAASCWQAPAQLTTVALRAARPISFSSQAWREQLPSRGPPRPRQFILALHSFSQA
jgi:hypothetical protein